MNATYTESIRQAAARESLTLEVTTKCNLDCPYCFALADLPEKTGMPFEMARSIVDEGRELGYRVLHLSGGEPTLWKPFGDLVEYALENGYEYVFFNTNAMLFTERMFQRFEKYAGRIACTVSLNGPEKIHEASRGDGSYAPTIRGIQAALDHGWEVEIFTTVHRPLLAVMPEFIRDVFQRFPQLTCLTLVQLHRVENDYYDVSRDLLSPEEFVSLVRLAGFLGRLYPIRFLDNPLAGVLADRMGLEWVWSPPLIRPGRLAVLHNGNICPAHSNRAHFTRYEPGRLREVHESAEYAGATSADDAGCSGCRYREDCRDGGLLRPSEKHRDMHEDIPFCVRANTAADRFSASPVGSGSRPQ